MEEEASPTHKHQDTFSKQPRDFSKHERRVAHVRHQLNELRKHRPMGVTVAELEEARIPVGLRDYCAASLLPLTQCRRAEYYLPWKCENERHAYEKCQFEELMRRNKFYLLEKELKELEAK
eukprot:TRINITY_DN14406_c0_g1_i1.p1 TRINITY_DN14406_c0_g1~~TRINITY_DN14406_c0_g1_i1.p1  ORF type:complete len:121 (+),score=28.87 TRINITY_DN14406_c0_g1_i1:30-392(+)